MVTEAGVKSASRDGVKLAYLEAGSGEAAIVFIHGWTCNRGHWRNQVAEFSVEHQVVALDLRGHGDSDKPDQDYDIAGFADDVDWLISELGLTRPIVVGHSMGGVIAAHLARTHPEATRGIVLVDAPIVPLAPALKPVADGAVAGLQGPAYQQVAEDFLREFMFNDASDPKLREEIVQSSLRTPQRVMRSAVASIFTQQEALGGPLSMPSLFVRAATQYATEDEIRAHLPGIEVAEVDCAHFIQLEKPGEFNALLSRFLEKVR